MASSLKQGTSIWVRALTAHCKILLFCSKTVGRNSDLARRRRTRFWLFGDFLVRGQVMQCFFTTLGVFVVTKTLEDEWYVVIKAYNIDNKLRNVS